MTKNKRYPHVYEVTRNSEKQYKSVVHCYNKNYNCGYFPYTTEGATKAYEAARDKIELMRNKHAITVACNAIASGKIMVEDIIKISGTINRLQHGRNGFKKLMKDIEHYVCLWFGVDPSEIHTTSRKQRLNDPRSMCMYFMYKLGHTLTSIGKYYRKDHTTVLHHYYAISDRAEVDDDTKHIINRIELMIYDTTRTVHNRPQTNTIPARDTTLFAGSHQEQPRNAIMV